MKSVTLSTFGGPVHYADFGGQGAPVVLVHGLGGAHTNWMAVGGELAKGHRVLALDLIGFGKTPLAGRAPDIDTNVELVSRFLDEVAGGPAVLVGNSMGGLVATLTAAAHPSKVSHLVLVNPALPRPLRAPIDPVVATLFAIYMTPGLGELFLRRRMAKLGPEKVLRSMLRLCGVDPARVPRDMYEASLALAVERSDIPWANQAFIRAARSLMRVNARRERVHSVIRRVTAPALFIQGTADRLVPVAVSRDIARLRPDWSFEIMEGVGHTPMIEEPERWIEAVRRFLER